MIKTNTFNTVPIWPSKEYWWCNRPTFQGVSMPVVTHADNPPFRQVTLSLFDVFSRSVTVSGVGMIGGHDADTKYTFPDEINDSYMISNNGHDTGGLIMKIYRNGDQYDVYISVEGDDVNFARLAFGNDMTKGFPLSYMATQVEELSQPRLASAYITSNGGESFISKQIHLALFGTRAETPYTLYVMNLSDDTQFLKQSRTLNWEPVPETHRTHDMFATAYISGNYSIGRAYSGRVYYEMFKIGWANGCMYYSEPFMPMQDSDIRKNYVEFTYRNTQPLVSGGNYIPAGAYSHVAYLRGTLMRPPYVFNEDVEELDGRFFVSKRVSYRKSTLTTHMNGYMADAIRFIWMCDEVNVSDRLYSLYVEYMESPELSWDDSSHIVKATLTFISDTVALANGNTVVFPTDGIGVRIVGESVVG